MNERIKELVDKIWAEEYWTNPNTDKLLPAQLNRFAELIVEECRNVVTEVYRKTPLELCGPLLTADEEIVKHFYGVEE